MTALETVQTYYAYFNNRQFEEMIALLDDNILHQPNQGQPRVGKTLFRAFMELMDTSYEETLTDMVFLSEPTNERVAVEFVVNGIYKKGEEGFPVATGQSYVLPAAAFLEVKNGLITRVTTYYNLEQWIELVSPV